MLLILQPDMGGTGDPPILLAKWAGKPAIQALGYGFESILKWQGELRPQVSAFLTGLHRLERDV